MCRGRLIVPRVHARSTSLWLFVSRSVPRRRPPLSDLALILRSSRILGSSVVIDLPHVSEYSETTQGEPVMDGIQARGQSASSFLCKLILFHEHFPSSEGRLRLNCW